MPVMLDSTVGGATANSNVSVEYADAYFAARLYATAWTSLTGDAGLDKKKQALIMATLDLEQLDLDGEPTTRTQSRAWPRIGMCDRSGRSVPSTIIPDDVQIATCEHAHALLTIGRDPGATDPLANFAAVKVGPIAIQLREPAPRTASASEPMCSPR